MHASVNNTSRCERKVLAPTGDRTGINIGETTACAADAGNELLTNANAVGLLLPVATARETRIESCSTCGSRRELHNRNRLWGGRRPATAVSRGAIARSGSGSRRVAEMRSRAYSSDLQDGQPPRLGKA